VSDEPVSIEPTDGAPERPPATVPVEEAAREAVRAPRPRLARWVAEAVGPLCVLGFAAWKYAPVSLGAFPVARDHTVHLFKAWLTEKVLAHGSVIGWSDLLDSGYPVNQFYPPGGSLWVIAVRALTGNLAPREPAYAVAVFLACALLPLGLYAIARRPLGRIGAAIAGALSAAEVGGWYQGGWHFSIHWGVWGTSFAVGLGFLATALLVRSIRERSSGALVGAGLLAAAAVLAHPFGLLALALVAPLRLLQLWAWPDRRGEARPPLGPLLLRAAAFGALAFGGCAFWLVPYAARAGGWALSFGDPWLSLPTLLEGLARGTTLDDVSPGWVLAGLVGPLLAIAAGRRFGAYLLALFAAATVVGSTTGLRDLGLGLFFPQFYDVQGERFAYLMRAALWLGVGAGVGGVLDLGRAAQGRLSPRVRRPVAVAAGLVAVAAAAAVVASSAGAWLRTPFPPEPWASTDRHHAGVKAAAAWLREHTAGDPFYRVLAQVPGGYQYGMLLVAPYADVAVAKTGFHAAETFRNLGAGMDAASLAAQNVRFVLDAAPVTRDDLALRGRFGPLYLYEFTGYRPERVEVVGGPGAVRVERFDDGAIAVAVSDAAPDATLRFHVAPYATWRARVNGRVVPWHEGRVGAAPVLELPAQNGTIELEVVPRNIDALGRALTGLAALAVLAWAVLSRERFRGLRERVVARGAGAIRWTPAVGAVLVLLAGGAVAARAAGVGRPWSLLDHLGAGHATVGASTCPHRGIAGGYVCDGRRDPTVYRGKMHVGGAFTPGVIAGVASRMPTVIDVNVPIGKSFTGSIAIGDATADLGGPPATVEVDGLPEVRLELPDRPDPVPFAIDTAAFAGQTRHVRFRLGGDAAKKLRNLCLEAHVE
jgi:hypothetical protein